MPFDGSNRIWASNCSSGSTGGVELTEAGRVLAEAVRAGLASINDGGCPAGT